MPTIPGRCPGLEFANAFRRYVDQVLENPNSELSVTTVEICVLGGETNHKTDELLPVWLAELKEDVAVGTPKAFATSSPGFGAALPWEQIRFINSAREVFIIRDWTGAQPSSVASREAVTAGLQARRLRSSLDKGDTRLREAHDILAAWDHRATNESVAMTLFNGWRDRTGRLLCTYRPAGLAPYRIP